MGIFRLIYAVFYFLAEIIHLLLPRRPQSLN